MYITYNNSGVVMAIYDNETALPPAVKEQAVFMKKIPAKPSTGNYRLMYAPENGLWWEEIRRKVYLSKLAIRRELRTLGMEEALDQYLEANPIYKKDWQDADALELSDPAFATAWEALKSQIENTDKFIRKVRV